MSKSPQEQIPLIYNLPNPNLNSSENNPLNKSQPSSPQIQNPPPKSPINQPHKNPDLETPSIDQSSNLLVNIDQEQNPQFQQSSNLLANIDVVQEQDCCELEQGNQEEEEGEDEEEGINMSQSPLPKSSVTNNSMLVSCSTRGNKKRKNMFSNFGFQRKIQVLSEGFKPVPFVPSNFFEVSKHKEDLEKLGLWDFANVEFDSNLRADLLVQLVASYKPKDRSSKVNGCSIKVSRPDMGRALNLPVKKVSGNCCEGESFSDGFISFLDEFVSSRMLMDCDVRVTPDEVRNWMNMIKDGQLRKIDWAGLIWFMIEKELLKGKDLKKCYYASHLQQLIKHQRKELLAESENLGVESKKVEEINLESDEEEGDTEILDVKESSLGDENQKVEECAEIRVDKKCVAPVPDNVEKESDSDMLQKECDVDMVVRVDHVSKAEMNDEASELKVGDTDEKKNEINVEFPEKIENTDNVEFIENEEDAKGMTTDDMVDFGIGRGWLMDGMDDGGQYMTGQSGLKILNEDASRDGDDDADGDADMEDEDMEDEMGEDDDQGFNFIERSPMDIMTSRNLVQAIGTEHHLSYNNVELGGQSSLGLMPSTSENDVIFNHVVKREIDHDHDFSHHALHDNHKRMRMDGHWDHKPPNSETCMGQLSQWLEKSKMAFETEKFEQANMIQILTNQLAEKEVEVIQWRCRSEEQERKMRSEVNRLDRELHLMNSVIVGYRKALKDSQMAFAEYRKRCRIPDEPIYKDVGSGGVVKSIMELEKETIKREEEQKWMCHLLEDAFNKHIIDYECKWEELHSKVMALDGRLICAKKVVAQLKDDFVQRKVLVNPVMSQEVQSDAQKIQEDDFVKCETPEDAVMSEETHNEGQEVPVDDTVENEKSEDAVMPDEGQSDAQGL